MRCPPAPQAGVRSTCSSSAPDVSSDGSDGRSRLRSPQRSRPPALRSIGPRHCAGIQALLPPQGRPACANHAEALPEGCAAPPGRVGPRRPVCGAWLRRKAVAEECGVAGDGSRGSGEAHGGSGQVRPCVGRAGALTGTNARGSGPAPGRWTRLLRGPSALIAARIDPAHQQAGDDCGSGGFGHPSSCSTKNP